MGKSCERFEKFVVSGAVLEANLLGLNHLPCASKRLCVTGTMNIVINESSLANMYDCCKQHKK